MLQVLAELVAVFGGGGVFRSVSALPEFGHWALVEAVSGHVGGGGMFAIPPLFVRLANGSSSSVSDQA